MKELRKALRDVLVQSLNTEQMNHLGRDVDPNFNIYEYSGFGDKIVVPRKVAADCVLQYFESRERLLDYIAYMITREGHGASGGVIRLKGMDRIVNIIRDMGFVYDAANHHFVQDQAEGQSAGWGFMKQEHEYHLSFVSIDIISSSELVRTNVKDDLDLTIGRFKAYVHKHVEFWDGRVWFWYGDGGLAAYYGEDCCPMSVLSMLSVLGYLPVFNIAENALRPENDIKLRIGMHYGTAVYKNDVNKMTSQDMKFAQDLEKHAADPNSIALSEAMYRMLPDQVRRSFYPDSDLQGSRVYKYTMR